jgi:hypothetical protein
MASSAVPQPLAALAAVEDAASRWREENTQAAWKEGRDGNSFGGREADGNSFGMEGEPNVLGKKGYLAPAWPATLRG